MVTPSAIPSGDLWIAIFLSWVLPITYIWGAICINIIANKTSTPNSWLAWVPVANIYLMCKVADKSGWWTLLFFVPFANIVILIIVWMNIAKALKMPSWLGVLMLIPCAHFIITGILAFAGKRINE